MNPLVLVVDDEPMSKCEFANPPPWHSSASPMQATGLSF